VLVSADSYLSTNPKAKPKNWPKKNGLEPNEPETNGLSPLCTLGEPGVTNGNIETKQSQPTTVKKGMHRETENARTNTNVYYLKKVMVANSTIDVWNYNPVTNE
jgi:hypothetical protein